MYEFAGYAFIGNESLVGKINIEPESVVVLNDRITKADLIRWGWYTKYNVPNTYMGRKNLEVELKKLMAFEYNGQYYIMEDLNRVYSFRDEVDWNQTEAQRKQRLEELKRLPYFSMFYENGKTTNQTVVDLITQMMGAPFGDQPKFPITSRNKMLDGKWVSSTVWAFPSPPDGEYYTFVKKDELIPGVGYQYTHDSTFYNQHEEVSKEFITSHGWKWGDWNDYKDQGYVLASKMRLEYIIHLPNCELSPHTCIRVKLTLKIRNKITLHGAETDGYIESVTMSPYSLFFPVYVRRIPMPRYQPRTATDAISCYVMNRTSVKMFIEQLYSTDIYDKIQKMLYGDGANNLLSLKWFYGVRPSVATSRYSKITLGNVVIDKVSTGVFNGEFVQVYLGYVNVKREYNDYRDYTNVRYQVYIPMVGNVDLDPAQVVGKDLHLVYTVNLTDGSAVVTLAVSNYMVNGKPALSKTNGWYDTPQIVFTTSITYGYEIPLNVEAIRTASLTVGEVAAKAIIGGAAGAIAGSLPGAVIGAVGGAASGALDGGVQSTYSSGALTANSNVMGDFVPKLTRIITKDASGDISAAVGAPSGRVVTVGDARGYLKAAMVYGTPSTTMQHVDEIVNMLKEGIYIS